MYAQDVGTLRKCEGGTVSGYHDIAPCGDLFNDVHDKALQALRSQFVSKREVSSSKG